jgi:hypothetical protein
MLKKISIALATLFLPAFAFAQPSSSFGGIGATVNSVISFINSYLVPFVFAAAFLVFIWGMFKFFIMGGHSDEARGQGKSLMLWGVVGFVMMVSIWGVVNVVADGLGFRSQQIQQIPNVPQPR